MHQVEGKFESWKDRSSIGLGIFPSPYLGNGITIIGTHTTTLLIQRLLLFHEGSSMNSLLEWVILSMFPNTVGGTSGGPKCTKSWLVDAIQIWSDFAFFMIQWKGGTFHYVKNTGSRMTDDTATNKLMSFAVWWCSLMWPRQLLLLLVLPPVPVSVNVMER